ncbi:MAG: hypothetical protein O7G84_16645, partial [Gammaproteobacteria bacterium]|nr:hypothetical protein [Gammaproteobacteria bacterium]
VDGDAQWMGNVDLGDALRDHDQQFFAFHVLPLKLGASRLSSSAGTATRFVYERKRDGTQG